jgi:hypothetical protein
VYQLLTKANIDSEFLIKDCDSFFDHEITSGNYVCVSKIQNHEVLKKIGSKSFVISNDQGIITSIIEKQIVSDTFCVGGYKFESAAKYKQVFETLNMNREIFVSDVIQQYLSDKEVITEKQVSDYVDVGTSSEWFEYNNKPTYFCDIDGTIIMSKDHNATEVEPLKENVAVLLKELDRGCKIIFCTARSEDVREQTRKILDNLGFESCDLIMEVHHSRRVLINDYASSNPYPTAVSINLKRDTDNLSDFLNT